jgi:glycosidase
MEKENKIMIYQALPRLFGNKTKKLVPHGSIEKNGCGKFNDFTTKALEEIKNLGITHIWYTGILEHATQTDYSKYGIAKDHPAIVKGKAGSPYAIKDFYDVDPDLAEDVPNRMAEFQDLVSRTHNAGLKVIIDFIPNHVARQYKSDAKPKKVKDIGENDIKEVFFSRDNNFYYLPGEEFAGRFDMYGGADEKYSEFPAKSTGNDYFRNDPSIYDWYETVKLNYGIDYRNYRYQDFHPTPDTWNKMRDILIFWTKKKIDGFRCDMAEMVPVEFWNWVIPQIKEVNPEILFIAETYNKNHYNNFLVNGKFDYLYDKVGLYETLRSVISNDLPAEHITYSWQGLNGLGDKMLNFLENHDEQRISSVFFANDAQKGIPGMIVAATMSCGAVLVYSGQEFGEKAMESEGFSGPDGRTSIFDYWAVDSVQRWINNGTLDGKKLTKAEKNIHAFYSKLLNICKKEKAIAQGLFFDLMYVNFSNPKFNTNKQYVFFRKFEDELLLIVANFDEQNVSLGINIPQHAFDYLEIPYENNKEYDCVDLLSGKKYNKELTPDKQLAVDVDKLSGVVLKFNL